MIACSYDLLQIEFISYSLDTVGQTHSKGKLSVSELIVGQKSLSHSSIQSWEQSEERSVWCSEI